MNKYGQISAAIAASFFLSTASIANAEPVYRYNGDSDYGYVSTSGFERAYLRVDRIKVNTSSVTGVTHTTRLYYNTSGINGYQYWSGEIANGDFTGDAAGKMTLKTNTCDYNPTPYCGEVTMTWTNDGSYSTQSSGVTHTETEYYTMRKSGTSKYSSANVSGMINGVSINLADAAGTLFGYGRMGSDRSTTLTINNK